MAFPESLQSIIGWRNPIGRSMARSSVRLEHRPGRLIEINRPAAPLHLGNRDGLDAAKYRGNGSDVHVDRSWSTVQSATYRRFQD